jgi:predicted RNA-binding Zn ribbon-like protein
MRLKRFPNSQDATVRQSVHPYPESVLVGDHLAMDFLNSIEVLSNPATECLRDGEGLVRWLEKAGAISKTDAKALRAMRPADLDRTAAKARELREWFRVTLDHLVARKGGRSALSKLTPLTDLLEQGNWYWRIAEGRSADRHEAGKALYLADAIRWSRPDQSLQPVARAMAALICDEDWSRIKHCGNHVCSLAFLDRTKANKRRWCSMAVCGNRMKNAAHRARVAKEHE